MAAQRSVGRAPSGTFRASFRAAARAGRWRVRALGVVLVAVAGCGLFGERPKLDEPVGLIAVLPIEREERTSTLKPVDQPTSVLAPDAEEVITAQVYDVLSSSPKWRFVPDLTVSQALEKIPKNAPLTQRAMALGKAVGADAVLCGTVSRFVEREGSAFGARQPAAVSFTLMLVSSSSGKLLWTGSFDQQQEALSTNLFNWWQFWEGGPRWFSAAEFAHMGVERLLDQLADQAQT